MRLVRLIAALGVLAVLAWCGWWWLAAEGQRRAIQGWLDGRARAGWQAEAAAITVTGFPWTFDRRITAPALADPRAGWAWSAPQIEADSAALGLNRIVVRLPNRQSLAVPGARAEITADLLTADLGVAPDTRLGLQALGLEARALAVQGPAGWAGGAALLTGRLAARAADTGPANSYDLDVTGEALRLPAALLAALDPTGALAPQADRLVLDAIVALDAPLDLGAIERGRIDPRSIVLTQALVSWGRMELALRGRVEIDADGYPVGKLAVGARNWREMVALARRSGALGDTQADLLTQALELAALLGGGGERLEVTLGLGERRIRIGPVTIADAPRLAAPRAP